MRSSKFNRHAEFYALKDMIFNGRAYLKGQHFPKQGITLPRVEILFNQGRIGYEWQISITAPLVVKEDVVVVPKPAPVLEVPVAEKPSTEGEQEKPKAKAKKKKTKKAAKKSSAGETDEGDE